jgi:hypothetical protein
MKCNSSRGLWTETHQYSSATNRLTPSSKRRGTCGRPPHSRRPHRHRARAWPMQSQRQPIYFVSLSYLSKERHSSPDHHDPSVVAPVAREPLDGPDPPGRSDAVLQRCTTVSTATFPQSLLSPQIENLVRLHTPNARPSTTVENGVENEIGLSALMEREEVETLFGRNSPSSFGYCNCPCAVGEPEKRPSGCPHPSMGAR